MNINLIVIGKLKEDYLKSACDEYLKRLRKYCNIKVFELPEYRLPEKPSEKEISIALENESKDILKYASGFIISMCIEGKQLSSEDFSAKLSQTAVNGNSTISIIIGSSFGLSDTIKQKSDFKLSMSLMTFPHQLARVMLLEQIYRAFQISTGGKYHK